MKHYLKFCKIIGLFFLVVSCSSDSDLLIADIKAVKKDHGVLNGAYIIINYDSCLPCVESVESFMLKSLQEKSSINFILTGYPSQKYLLIKFGSTLKVKNLSYDLEEIFYKERSLLKYPLYLEIIEDEIVKKVVLNPDFDLSEISNL